MFLGDFLLKRGVVSAIQIIEALDYQERCKKTLGRLALESGKLTDIQVLSILNRQSETGKMFAHTAKELKLLDDADLTELLTLQALQHTPLGEALVETGAIERKTLEREMRLFWEHKQAQPSQQTARWEWDDHLTFHVPNEFSVSEQV